MKQKLFLYALAATSLGSIILILNVTSPNTAGPFGILVLFVLIYLLSLSVITFLIYEASVIFAKMSIVMKFRKPLDVLDFKICYYFSTFVASFPVLMIGLQSVGAASIYSLVLVLIFIFIGCLYVAKLAIKD